MLVSLYLGLFPLAALDLNAFSHYTSPYHALDAVKGFVFALLFLPLIKSEWRADAQRFAARLALGMSAGLALELAFVLWERVTFSGLTNFATGYRITGTFPAIAIGGASIEAYLVFAAPFVWLLAWLHRRAATTLAAGVLYALAAYGVMVTFSRGGQGAFVLSAPLLLLGFGVLMHKHRLRVASGGLVLVVAVLAAGLVAWPIISGKFSESRLATVKTDFDTRVAHWRDTLSIFAVAGNPWLGAGSGSYAREYYWYSSAPERPSTYTFVRDGDNVALRLRGGESLYFEQQVDVLPDRVYRLALDIRSSAQAGGLTVPLCEKSLLYSFACVWNTIKLVPGNGWQHYELALHTDRFNAAHSVFSRPVKLSLFNQDKRVAIDVDNVQLLDSTGHNLVSNGDFSQGMQRWFFSTDSHLAWHAKNLFLHVLFEQGWIGLIAFVALLATAAIALLRRVHKDALALTLGVSFVALLVVGTIDSLIDDPRIDFLFFWLLLIALVSSSQVLPSRRRRARVHRQREPGYDSAPIHPTSEQGPEHAV
jgi:O-antigen ligase